MGKKGDKVKFAPCVLSPVRAAGQEVCMEKTPKDQLHSPKELHVHMRDDS